MKRASRSALLLVGLALTGCKALAGYPLAQLEDTGIHDSAAVAETSPELSMPLVDTLSLAEGPPRCVDPICDLWPQCGCPAGQKCDLISISAVGCTLVGSGLHGEVCVGTTDCSAGTTCADAFGWGGGLRACTHFCASDADCKALGAGARCWLAAATARLCTLPCEPVAQSGCPGTTQCSFFNSGNEAGTHCIPPGTEELGAACEVHFDCAPTLACVNQSCRKVCIVGDATPCTSSTTCVSLDFVIGSRTYGACL